MVAGKSYDTTEEGEKEVELLSLQDSIMCEKFVEEIELPGRKIF